jgi:hypothetical protein
MPTPTIHELGNSFDERNVCLGVALGMISFLRRFKKVLRVYGSPGPKLVDAGDRERSDEAESLLYGTLGLISFSASLMRHLEATRAGASGLRKNGALADSPSSEAQVTLRQLLR